MKTIHQNFCFLFLKIKTGHGSDVWWTLVAEKDYKMLNRHRDSKMLDRYLNEGAATKTVPAKYNKFVRTASASRTYGSTPQNNYLPREVKPGSPMFIPRDPLFGGELLVFLLRVIGRIFFETVSCSIQVNSKVPRETLVLVSSQKMFINLKYIIIIILYFPQTFFF